MAENRAGNENGAVGTGGSDNGKDRLQAPVPQTRFYGKSAAPLRTNNGEGSSHTMYVPPEGSSSTSQAPVAGSSYTSYYAPEPTNPPSYGQPSSSFREPELVTVPEDERIPDLIDGWGTGDTSYAPDQWGREYNNGWPAHDTSIFDVRPSGPPIDGRNEDVEKDWWDKSKRDACINPGPGMLPPLMADKLHNSEHTLFMVTVTPPDIKPEPKPSETAAPVSPTTSSSMSSSPFSRSSAPPAEWIPPSNEEVLQAIPHPHAYFCRKHNGWVLLAWKSSSVLPPLAESFDKSGHPPLPNPERRKRVASCVTNQEGAQKVNMTHHFHYYEKAVDARQLNPGYSRKSWEMAGKLKAIRRRGTIIFDEELGDIVSQGEKATPGDEEPDLLDLYICCQCSFYAVVSDVIPGVIPPKYMDEITNDRLSHPALGKPPQQCVITAWETVLQIIENKLWKGNEKGLSIGGKAFSAKLGWKLPVQKLFDALGFAVRANEDPNAPPNLMPPKTDPSKPDGKSNRDRLLRSWVEIGAYLAEYKRRFPKAHDPQKSLKLWIKVESAREAYQDAIGAHPSQLSRGGLPQDLQNNPPPPEPWEKLGMTTSSYDPALLHFAYLAQCRCDPERTVEYFTALRNIVDSLKTVFSCPEELQNVLVTEESRGRFTSAQFDYAVKLLGFGKDNKLQMDFDDDVEDEFILNAWKDATRRTWMDPEGAAFRHELNEACRQIAKARGSGTLLKTLEEEIVAGMTPDKAYSTLEVPDGVDEEMLLTVYSMRVEEQPAQLENMRRALKVIAEYRNSDRLLRFLETGADPGVVTVPVQPDWPRGLNQLGNTCYLNSLLQYFYTIKDLREAIAPLASATSKFTDDDKLKDDDLKNHRVGGRLVTRREVLRSRKFVSQLAGLFQQLEWSDTPAVTPTLELAKLALVTSKDEEEDDTDRGGTETSNSTDATLVDEPTPIVEPPPPRRQSKSASPPAPSPSSVLGKRPRMGRKPSEANSDLSVETMEEDPNKEGYVVVSRSSGSPQAESSAAKPIRDVQAPERDADGDVEMRDVTDAAPEPPKAPPLPPRPKVTPPSSDMLFGKQHDVAECMDNCMFQIETALLEFGELEISDPEKLSIVKRLFYGKLKQRLKPQNARSDPSKSKASMHEREDVFSHLPVNVTHESFDLYDGLSGYFDDVVEFEGKSARMEVGLVELPPILQIQLQRVQFDRETVQAYKSHTYVKFGETLCMDRFLDDAPSGKKTRSKVLQRELNSCRDRIYKLSQGPHAPYAAALNNTFTFLSKQEGVSLPEADDDLLASLQGEATGVNEEIEKCRTRVASLKEQLEELWADQTRAQYDLTAVFIHRGASPAFGHYFIYQRWLPDRPNCWIKYNDSDVKEVPKEEVLADTTGSTANPYLLVFTRRDANIVHTIQRGTLDFVNAMDTR